MLKDKERSQRLANDRPLNPWEKTAPVEALHTQPLRRCASPAISAANALIQCHNPKMGSSPGAACVMPSFASVTPQKVGIVRWS